MRTAERLVSLIAIFCILGWRIFRMAMLDPALPNENPEYALAPAEIRLLDQLAGRGGRMLARSPTLSAYLGEIARLGGYRREATTRHRAKLSCGADGIV